MRRSIINASKDSDMYHILYDAFFLLDEQSWKRDQDDRSQPFELLTEKVDLLDRGRISNC